MNFIVDGVVTGGPVQDVYDQQIANIADVFLGITHRDCLLCHNGAGHLDRPQSLGTAADSLQRLGHGLVPFAYQYDQCSGEFGRKQPSLLDRRPDTGTKNYALNTTSGNRPARSSLSEGKT